MGEFVRVEVERLHFAGLFATEDQRTEVRRFAENGPGKATFAGAVSQNDESSRGSRPGDGYCRAPRGQC